MASTSLHHLFAPSLARAFRPARSPLLFSYPLSRTFFCSSTLHNYSSIFSLSNRKPLPSIFRAHARFFTHSTRISIYYRHPPTHRRKLFLAFLDKIPENAILYTIIGLNVIVFGMWYLSSEKYRQMREPSSVNWMIDNFTSSWHNFSAGRIWTPLTCCFSHKDMWHFLFNNFTLFFMAQPVLQILGSRHFLFLYLGGGIFSAFSSIAWANGVSGQDIRSMGASGAIYSIMALLACVAPKLSFQLYGIIPVPAWLAVSGIFAYDTYRTLSHSGGATDTMGHVGGMMAGIGYFLARRRGII